MEIKQGKQLSIKQNMLWNSAGSLVNLCCQWLISIMVVRLSVGFEAAGIYSLATSVYAMFSPISHYRTYTYQISDVHQQYRVNEYLTFRMLTCFLCLIITMGYAFVTCSLKSLPTILLFTIWKLASMLIDVFHAVDQQKHRMDFIGKSLALQGILSLLVFIAIYPISNSLELPMGMMAASTIIILIVFDIPMSKSIESFSLRPKISRIKALLLVCLPAVIANIAYSASSSLPRQYLANIMGNDSLGIYASIAAPVAILQTGAAYIYNPLIGYFAEMYDERNLKGFKALLFKAIGGVLLLGLLASILLIFLGPTLLTLLYGSKIKQFSDLLFLLVPASLGLGLTGFMNDLLVALRAFKHGLISSVIALLTVIALSNPLIEVFGMNGLSISMILSSALSFLYMSAILSSLLKKKGSEIL